MGPSRSLVLTGSDLGVDDSNDQKSLISLFNLLGLFPDQAEARRTATLDLAAYDTLVIPRGTAGKLGPAAIRRLLHRVERGAFLITDGDSDLARALGIRLAAVEPVEHVRDISNTALVLRWPDKPSVPFVTSPSSSSAETYYADASSRPLVIGDRFGKGEFLYSAPLIDPLTPYGYSRFPGIPYLLVSRFKLAPVFRAQRGEAYFDSGFRDNVPIEVLAHLWRQWGVTAVYAAAWQRNVNDTYDYEKLIRAAHANGVRVYAWFEWPHINEKFWDDHPSWREKTATKADAHIDWRSLMNLQNPRCLEAALAEMKTLLRAHSWDGVNVGEIYFEPVGGPANAANFTPMNDDVRRRFKKEFHFDPIALFHEKSSHYWRKNPADLRRLYEFRKTLSAELLERVLREVTQMNAPKKDWEIMVTAIDVATTPELADYIGNDMPTMVNLARRYGATLQVEDPFLSWQLPPERYLTLAGLYDRLFHQRPAILDINVVPAHPDNQVGFPTGQPTGAELLQLWRTAAGVVRRVCFYAEFSVDPKDWSLLPYVMGSLVQPHFHGDAVTAHAPYAVQLLWPFRDRKPRLDHSKSPCRGDGSVWLPPGDHRVEMLPKTEASSVDITNQTLLSASCDVTDCEEDGDSLRIRYDSLGRCLLTFGQDLKTIRLDGLAATSLTGSPTVFYGPSGRHDVLIQ